MVRKVAIAAAVSPMDTLAGSSDAQHRRIAATASSPLRPPSSPSRTRHLASESQAEHTTAQFAPTHHRNDTSNRPPHRGRKRSLDSATSITIQSDGSQSQRTARSAARNVTNSNVGELRGVPGYQKTPRSRKRHRTSHEVEVPDNDPIASQSPTADEVVIVDSRDDEGTAAMDVDNLGQRFAKKASAQRQKRVLSTNSAKEASPSKRGRTKHSPDHLAPTAEETSGKHAPSASISTRGDIPKSTFMTKTDKPSKVFSKAAPRAAPASPADAAKVIIGDGLEVRRAVSGRSRYNAEDQNEDARLTLVTREMSHMLHPVFANMDMAKTFEWCTINLTKVSRVELPQDESDSTLVYFSRSTDLNTFSAAFMMVEFQSTRDLNAFHNWCEMYNKHNSAPIRITRGPKLREKFENHWSRAAQSQETKEKYKTSRGGHAALAGSHEQADEVRKSQHDDISLVAKRVASRAINSVGYGESKARKLKDSMSTTAPSILPGRDHYLVPPESQSSQGRQTRTTRTTFALRETPPPIELPRWTKENPDWSKKWSKSVVYPPIGKNRAVVDAGDIERLDEGEFLNDNLVIFYLRYLQNRLEKERKDLADRIHFHNTFFYERLKPSKSGAGINYDNVKGWTNKVDIFSKDFIVVPINEFAHWYVAIICNAPKLIERKVNKQEGHADVKCNDDNHEAEPKVVTEVEEIKDVQADLDRVVSDVVMEDSSGLADELSRAKIKSPPAASGDLDSPTNSLGFNAPPKRKKAAKRQSMGPRQNDPNSPRIITLDSLASPHSPACGNLRNYLIAEAMDKRGVDISDTGKLGMTARDLPLQMNHCDCGLYLLGYIQEFLRDPDQFIRSLMLHEEIEWKLDSSALRNDIRSLLFSLQEEQKQREEAEAVERKNRKREAYKAKQQQVDIEETTEVAGIPTTEASVKSIGPPQTGPSANEMQQPPAPTIDASRLLQSTQGVFQGSEDLVCSTRNTQPDVVGLHSSIEESSAPAMKHEDQALPSRELDEEDNQHLYIPKLPDSPSSTSPSKAKSFVDASDDDDQETAEMVYKPDPALAGVHIEVQLPKSKWNPSKPSPGLQRAKHKVKQTGTTSNFFAGKRSGDQKGKARLVQTSARTRPSDVIDIRSDSE